MFDTTDSSSVHGLFEEDLSLSPETDRTILSDVLQWDPPDRDRYTDSVQRVETDVRFLCSRIRLTNEHRDVLLSRSTVHKTNIAS